MRSALKRTLIFFSAALACLATCAVIYFVPTTLYCEQRKNPPIAPIYPGSTLQDSDFFLVGLNYSLWPPKPIDIDEPGMSLATYYYRASVSPERIIEFYGEEDGVSVASNRYVIGNAEPFGEYNVGISDPNPQTDDGTTEYFIEIRWESCR